MDAVLSPRHGSVCLSLSAPRCSVSALLRSGGSVLPGGRRQTPGVLSRPSPAPRGAFTCRGGAHLLPVSPGGGPARPLPLGGRGSAGAGWLLPPSPPGEPVRREVPEKRRLLQLQRRRWSPRGARLPERQPPAAPGPGPGRERRPGGPGLPLGPSTHTEEQLARFLGAAGRTSAQSKRMKLFFCH